MAEPDFNVIDVAVPDVCAMVVEPAGKVKVECDEDDVKPADKSEDDVWTELQAINADALAKVKVVKEVRMDGIRMSCIDSVGQASKVPNTSRVSSS